MYKIYADYNRTFSNPLHTHLGNKIQHLLYLINVSSMNNRKPVVYSGSNLDNIFEFTDNTEILDKHKETDILFIEESAFVEQTFLQRLLKQLPNQTIIDVSTKSYKQYLEEKEFLHTDLPNKDFMIRGHFWHYDLMPTHEIFKKFMVIKNDLFYFFLNFGLVKELPLR